MKSLWFGDAGQRLSPQGFSSTGRYISLLLRLAFWHFLCIFLCLCGQ
jgi:hypothetical protein